MSSEPEMTSVELELVFLITYILNVVSDNSIREQEVSFVSLKKEPTDILFLNTMAASLNCDAFGYPTPKIEWLTESGLVVHPIKGLISIINNELLFHAFKEENYNPTVHNLKYKCKVSNKVGILISKLAEAKVVIDKPYSPVIHHQLGLIGGSAIFTCQVPYFVTSFVKVSEWLIKHPRKDEADKISLGRSQNQFHVLDTGDLIVSSILKEYEDLEFSCITRNIFNNATMTNAPGRLYVGFDENLVEPSNIVKPTGQVIESGQYFTLNCQADGLFDYLWFKDGKLLNIGDRISVIVGGSITVENAKETDAGMYKCTIKKKEFAMEYSAEIIIKVPLKIVKSPKDVFTKAGGVNSFDCSAVGSAPFQKQWFKDGILLQPNNRISIKGDTLTIFDTNLTDEGVYQCVVTNKYETVQAAARLIVNGLLPKIESISEDGVIDQGSLLKLSCSFSGQPLPEIGWFLDNEKLNGESANITIESEFSNKRISFLTIDKSETKDSGQYTCMVENNVGYIKAFSTILVKGSPTILGFKRQVYGVTKKSLTIDCRGKGYPDVSFKWYKKGIQLSQSSNVNIYPNGTIHLKKFSENYVGIYWCEVSNKYGSYKATVDVINLDPPQVLPFTLHSVLIGDRSEFFCTLTRGSEVGLNYSWFKDGVQISATNQRTLLINKVQDTDRGRYTCVVENNAGKDSYSNDFTVYEEPSFIKSPTDVSVLEGYSVILPCLAKGFPQPQITWFRRINDKFFSVLLNQRIKQLQNGTLYIGASHASDNGTYVCQASFFDQDIVPDPLSKEIQIEVRVPPRIVFTSPSEIREGKMQAVKIYCSAIGSLMLSVKWFKNSAIISNDNSKHVFSTLLSSESVPPSLNSTLLVTDLSQDDNGAYECMFINPFGIYKKEFKLFVEEEPHHPESLKQISSTSRSIHLSWKPGFDGNSPITSFRLEMKSWSANWNQGKFFITKEANYLVEGLNPGSKYSFRVSSSNRHGISEKSDEISFDTKEEAPSGPPVNVTVISQSKDKLLVTWLAPEKIFQNGVISSYRICYVPAMHRSVAKQCIDVGAINFTLLQGLLQFTSYQISVQAMTNAGVGPASAGVFASTLEGVPSLAPPSVKAHTVNSQTLFITWKIVPEAAVNGILRGYKVIYIDVEHSEKHTKSVLNAQETLLNGLRKFTDYQIGVLAYTNAGDGVLSQYIFQKTDEDIPDAPSEFSATPASPSEISVTWNEPIVRNGIITDYVLYYQEVGQYSTHRIELKSEEQSYKLQDLKFGQKYLIWMSAKTSKGEGQSTKRITTTPKDQVPSKIITPPRWTSTAKIGSDIVLPCAAVGHPKPIITWYKSGQSFSARKQKRFMAADMPYTLFNVQEEDEGFYNCTAENKYGIDWNIVTLIVQTPPKPPHTINAYLVHRYSLNITWLLGFNGNSAIMGHHVRYAEPDKASTWIKVKLTAIQAWIVVHNVSSSPIFFEVASENDIGIGQYSETLKFVVSGNSVEKSLERIVFAAKSSQVEKGSLKKIMQPTLIVLLIVASVIIILLLVASWDRDQKRLRKPAAYRLLCSLKRDRNFNSDPYGEPALPWPWNIRKGPNTDYDYIDSFGMPDEYFPFSYLESTAKEPHKSTKVSQLGKGSCNSFIFKPAVNYSVNYIDEGKKTKCTSGEVCKRVSTKVGSTQRLTENHDNPEANFSAMEKLMLSPPLQLARSKHSSHKTSSSAEISLLTLNSPFSLKDRGMADGKSLKDISSQSTLQDSSVRKREIFQENSQTSASCKSKSSSGKRKSFDGCILKTLESIEEKKILGKINSNRAELITSPKVALTKDYLENTVCSYESISSTCSSSVGELKRAYEFGKKFGLQDLVAVYNTNPDFDDKELTLQAHEKLLETLLFSGIPCDLNDTKVKIPIPLRLDHLYENQVNKIDLGGSLREQSLV